MPNPHLAAALEEQQAKRQKRLEAAEKTPTESESTGDPAPQLDGQPPAGTPAVPDGTPAAPTTGSQKSTDPAVKPNPTAPKEK